ncbi:hypothetical protein MGYG_02167 [Nannizzia gypsea CBS 118893]|uniref:Nuclear pore complex protein An-Nup82 n=1 Tax=Arthroderma gypseum (strain ATCC MYA-4604 / CBS 118893) TaxID=535722 RepID=E4UQ21_ARTGP|nr:hypothetical protein MGYG_02167 [Nannizzia gypsea CBS 118893]EFQ99155.1 hypothetical protein MGYG_02167 [Nannizzia gypsea CBS 118893]
MPRIVDYSPPWLARPSPGVDLFCPEAKDKSLSSSLHRDTQKAIQEPTQEPRPVRTLARRGTEVFTVIDNQIRWADLARLKDEWRKGVKQKREESAGEASGADKKENGTLERNAAREESEEREEGDTSKASYYRALNTPVYGKIEQLAVSPNGAFLAITTIHTVHIAILPDISHLSGPDYSPIRVKTFQLGPTTHVIPESPVVGVLWHPLGINDTNCGCIVTVTADSAVRLWEIDRKNHWSFDRPTLAIDLKKLVDGTSMDQDFTPLSFGQNKGFSADSFDMEVAAARFGGHGYEEEDAWASMTLWVAMRTGDVYALCPLLPSKWQASPVTVPSLTSSIVRELAIAQAEAIDSDDELKATQQQYEWLKEMDNQDISVIEDEAMVTEIRTRPTNPSPIPRLQGPFLFECEELEEDTDITDILVIASRADIDDLMAGEDEPELLSEIAQSGLSGTIICLLTSIGTLHVCLEMDGVKGQWLPRTCKNTFSTPMSEPSELLLLESLETVRAKDRQQNMWPIFSEAFGSRYEFFVTTARTVSFFSLSSWVHRMEPELRSEDTAGSAFRINIICDGEIAEREQMLRLPPSNLAPNSDQEHLAGCLPIFDYDLGYLLLTFSPSSPCAVLLDSPEYEDFRASMAPSDSGELEGHAPIPAHTRPPYQVPSVLYSQSPLVSFVGEFVPHGHRHTLKEPVRLSPSTLELFTSAHRILSAYTHALEVAASDLFRRCERLQGEMRGQLTQLVEVGERIHDVSNGTVRGTVRKAPVDREQALSSRLNAAQTRQKELTERYNNIRLRIIKAGGRPISEKEKVWMKEVDTLSTSIGEDDGKAKGELTERLETATTLAKELLSDMKNIPDVVDSTPSTPSTTQPKVPQRLQKAKVADAMNMVERESAVIDAITSRLERLSSNFPDLE